MQWLCSISKPFRPLFPSNKTRSREIKCSSHITLANSKQLTTFYHIQSIPSNGFLSQEPPIYCNNCEPPLSIKLNHQYYYKLQVQGRSASQFLGGHSSLLTAASRATTFAITIITCEERFQKSQSRNNCPPSLHWSDLPKKKLADHFFFKGLHPFGPDFRPQRRRGIILGVRMDLNIKPLVSRLKKQELFICILINHVHCTLYSVH